MIRTYAHEATCRSYVYASHDYCDCQPVDITNLTARLDRLAEARLTAESEQDWTRADSVRQAYRRLFAAQYATTGQI